MRLRLLAISALLGGAYRGTLSWYGATAAGGP
jgi:hypothetical protein